MKMWPVAAFAALVLSSCSNAPEAKAATSENAPQATQSAPARPAPVLNASDIVVSNGDINAGKNQWVAAQAAQYNITAAEVERRARFMRATPGMKVNVCGRSVAFTKTIWHSCKVAIQETRASQAQATAEVLAAPSTPRVAMVPKADYDNLLDENKDVRNSRNLLLWICIVLTGVIVVLAIRWPRKPAPSIISRPTPQTRTTPTPTPAPAAGPARRPLGAFDPEPGSDPDRPAREL